MGFPPHLIKFLFAKKLVQKTEHPAGLNKWGPLRVSNVFRPDNRVAGPWVGRGLFRLRLGAVAWDVLCVPCFCCGRVLRAGRGLFRLRLGLWREVFCVSSVSAVARSAYCRTWGPAVERVFCGRPACFGWRIFCAQAGAYFRARLGPLVCVVICGRVFGGCLGAVAWCVFCARLWVYLVCYEVDNSPLFNFNRIFPPFPGVRAETSAQKPLIWGYNAYGVGLMFGVRGP